MNISRIATVLLCALFAPIARAQFVGDFFFASPSTSVPAGQTVSLELRTFVGADAFGAAKFDLEVDPTLAVIESIEAIDSPQSPDKVMLGKAGSLARVVALNGRSITAPIGTIALARIQVRPLAAAGTTFAVSVRNPNLMRSNSTSFSTTRGFASQVTITSPSTVARNSEMPGESDLLILDWSAVGLPPLAPAGVSVLVHRTVLQRGEWVVVTRRIQLVDPSSPSERPVTLPGSGPK